MTTSGALPRRRRDAAQTRLDLLDVARRRFAHDGYAATTVRHIADEAGVNVALISRYFTSKEGLFQACLTDAVTDVGRGTDDLGHGEIAARLARRLSDTPGKIEPGENRLRDGLLLLVRTSGDERIDDLRRDFLRALSEKVAVKTGNTIDESTLLRAQILLAAVLGMVLLRSTLGIQPLSAAGEDELRQPLADLIDALLGTRGHDRR
ncbi:AcrR family transcriptional regulator [Actinoplanes lutulentus]|uniref:TetR family transcriptional regulator n=1 Tax=Actinoplanes lutulentus TaxID=1287878 RepID=A0A327Z423_9ACTN|nr:TetR/AcrR family transcriptional regulator [Actinoplanes lutulentus]MBB2946993.1 AcrR family transcriptional regulator [Actinoplanes lutulentus]RAK30495.1 TetR family transcriptional regulator [Actinoplanes lutulentus]